MTGDTVLQQGRSGSSVSVRCEETAPGVQTLTIDRPDALNALNSEVLDGIFDAVTPLPAGTRGIIVTGAGKAFVAGADIAEMADYGTDEAEAFSLRGQRAFQALADFPAPVVAAINGFALGGGLELALACDVLIASEKAKVGLPETTLGVVPGFGGTQRLPRRVGPGHAKRLLFTGAVIGAEEAQRIGLVDMVVPAEDLLGEAAKLIEKAAHNGPIAVREVKHLVDEGMDMPLHDALTMEAAVFGEVFSTKDQEAGMKAFLAKQKPTFTGE